MVPLVLPAEIERYQCQVALAKTQDITPILSRLIDRAGFPITAGVGLDTALVEGLTAQHPTTAHQVVLSGQGGTLQFAFEPYADGFYPLGELHRVLRPLDPWLLPALVRALEFLSGGLLPVCGPWRMEEYAEYLWSVDQFKDFGLEDRVTLQQHTFAQHLSNEQALRIMRRLGIPHEKAIRDTLPYPYFGVKDEPREAVKRLSRALNAYPQVREVQALAPLMDLLPQLIRLRRKVPLMTEEEEQQVTFLPPVYAAITPSPKRYCAVSEAADEFMRMHWDGGENSPGYVLQVGRSRASQDRLLGFLTLLPQFVTALDESLSCLGKAQSPD